MPRIIVQSISGRSVELKREFARRLSVAVDGMPVAGFAPTVENLYLLVSHSGATLAPVLGELVAGELFGERCNSLEPYRPTRFGRRGENDVDDDFDRRLRDDPEIARFQAMYLDGGIDGVALVAADSNACPTCLAVTDRSYIPSGLPPLPIAGCSLVGDCRCRYEPNVTVYE